MSNIFTGIGSRLIDSKHINLLYKIACLLEQDGWKCRTGDASGSDSVFRDAYTLNPMALSVFTAKHIQLNPYGNASKAKEIMYKYHPNPDAVRCNKFSEYLLARDVYQVLGTNLKEPSKIVICYTSNGELKGGTAMAIRIANAYGIPVLNIGNPKHYDAVLDYINNNVFLERFNKAFKDK